jgi:hypothetical protein
MVLAADVDLKRRKLTILNRPTHNTDWNAGHQRAVLDLIECRQKPTTVLERSGLGSP